MFVRLKRTATSFAVMVGVFWVYRLIAEPLIEPPVVEKRVAAATPEERAAAQQKRQNRLGVYARFFPEGSWERDNPIMLENGNSKVLLKEYNNHPDGQVDLNPCTVIHLPDGETDGDRQPPRDHHAGPARRGVAIRWAGRSKPDRRTPDCWVAN